MTDFGKKIKIALIEQEKTQKWLVEQVQVITGLTFDRWYLHRVMSGATTTPRIVGAIKKILNI